ncbi:MAG: hypothetical protein SR3Q1_12330 [Quinella sp. 3Q1]|nr:hypothetical protein [Quinella sp. 3Q1]
MMANAPQAILAYAQLYAYGLPEEPEAAGMTEEIIQSVQVKVIIRAVRPLALAMGI